MKKLQTRITKLGMFLMVAVTIFGIISPTAMALDADQKQLIDANVLHFNIRDTPPCTTGSAAPVPALDQQIAQTFWVGFDGSSTPDSVKAVITANPVGGIFFTTDFNTAGLDKAFFDSLTPPGGNKILVAADDEGGKVATFAKSTPSAAVMNGMPLDQIRALGESTGKAMADVGVTADLAPVLDIQTPGTLWTQTERDWSSNPTTITQNAGAFAQGLQTSGVIPVFKHFPGIGKIGKNGSQPNNTDKSRTDPQSLASMADDLAPYTTLIGTKSTGAVMLSNGFITEWNNGDVPVSISSDAVKYLRETLHFTGAITTDALNSLASYGAIAQDTPNAVASALAVGVDMPLFVVGKDNADATIKAAIQAVKAKNIPQIILDSAYNHSLALRGLAPNPGAAATGAAAAACCPPTGATGTVSGDGQEAIIMNFLRQQGFTVAGAAAAIGNMKVESGPTLKPNIQEGGQSWPNGGFGLVQWSFGRRITMRDFISAPPYNLSRLYVEDKSAKLNLSPEDNLLLMKAELDYFMKELTESYPVSLAIGKTATDAKAAAAAWEVDFEGCSPSNGPVKCDVELRKTYAQEIFDKFNGTTAGTPAAAAVACGSGTVSGVQAGEGVLSVPNGGTGSNMIYYSQCDPQWTAKGNGYNYCACACGQSSVAMLAATLLGDKTITPNTIYDAIGDSGSQGSGAFDPSSCSGSSVSALTAHLQSKGLQVQLVQGRGNGGLDTTKVLATLKQGHPMLVHTSKWVGFVNKHATSGHYLVIYGADAAGANFYVANPGSTQDNNVAIPAAGLSEWLDEAYAVWK